MDKKNVVIAVLGLLLLATATGGYFLLQKERDKNAGLEKQLAGLLEMESRHQVEKSISNQLKDIAFQQEQAADKRREEAERQAELARNMTRRADEERRKAEKARAAAELSEHDARQARDTAEKQRVIAEAERKNAEAAKKTADTLGYIALGSSLGSQSFIRYTAGDQKTASMLSYLSWYYTKNYGGDVYNPSVYQALSLCSGSQNSVAKCNGSVYSVKYFADRPNKIIFASSYGEIVTRETREDGTIDQKIVFNNKKYNFRELYALNDGSFYALSSTGHLVVFKDGALQPDIVLQYPDVPNRLCRMTDGKKIFVAGKHNFAILNMEANKIEREVVTDYEISFVGYNGGNPQIFDVDGNTHTVSSDGSVVDGISPVRPSIVTAYTSTYDGKFKAYGTKEGTILLDDGSGKIKHLIGHLSPITVLKFSGNRLYSSSMDRELKLWVINSSSESPDPMTLYAADGWILCFMFGKNRNYIWAGDAMGNLVEILVSTDMMAQSVKSRITDDFSREDWDYYIGKNVEYLSLKNL